MVKRIGGAYREADKTAAIEMYLNGPETMENVARVLGMSKSSLNIWLQQYRAKNPNDRRGMR